MLRFVSLSLVLLPFAITACADQADPTDTDALEVDQASTTVEATADTSYVTAMFLGDVSTLDGARVDTGLAQIKRQLQARLAARLTAPACAVVTSDGLTYVEATFTDCTGAHGLTGLSGTIRADVSFETVACGAGQCIAGVNYALSTEGVTLRGVTWSGDWQLHDPLAAGAPYRWTGALTIDGAARSLTSTSTATIAVDGDCVTYDLDATIAGTLRSLTVQADAVTRCTAACPTAGAVTVAGTRGTIAWTYDGDGTATVTGPRGATFDVALACSL